MWEASFYGLVKTAKRIWAIAEQDSNYIAWKGMHEQAKEPFMQYANQCPGEIKQILLGYAGSGEMMIQRILNIACKILVFPEEITADETEA